MLCRTPIIRAGEAQLVPCDTDRTWISAYLDGELAADDRQPLERHLASCAECAEELASLRGSLRLLRALLPEEPPAELRPQIMAAIAAMRPAPWNRLAALFQWPAPVARWSLAGAGLAAAVVVGVTSYRPAPAPVSTAPSPRMSVAANPVVTAPPVKSSGAPKTSPAVKGIAQKQPAAAPTLEIGARPIVLPSDSPSIRLANAITRRARARLAARQAVAPPPSGSRRTRTGNRPAPRRTGPLVGQPAGPSAADGFESAGSRPSAATDMPYTDVAPEDPSTMMAAMPLVSSGGPTEATPTSDDALAALRQRLAEQRREVPTIAVEGGGSRRDARSLPVKFEF
jgi:anti-sigma factor RsiW